jgi:gliding motility associated protien GldN
MKLLKLLASAFVVGAFTLSTVQAQEYGMEYASDGYNHNSLRPIHDSHIMYRKTLWFRVMLKEKQNKPFFAKNREITKLIVESTKLGLIRPYMNDSLRTRMTLEEFLERIKVPSEDAGLSEEELALGFTEDSGDDWGTEGDFGGSGGGASAAAEYFSYQLDVMQIKEDLIFDKKHSRMKHDIQSLEFFIPAKMNPTGVEKSLATFSYRELVNNVFKDNSDAIWYNEHNERTHVNYADAFDLRLFSGKIVKYSNGQDQYLIDIYKDDRSALLESQRYAHWLVEYETNLWEH